MQPSDEMVEATAERVYEAMRRAKADTPVSGPVPEWVPRGNSLMQDIARDAARAILTAALATIKAEPVAWQFRQRDTPDGPFGPWLNRPPMNTGYDHEQRLLYAHSAPPAPAVPAGWQLIETAPKDGRDILVYDPRMKLKYAVEIRKADGDWWRINGNGPTHWMPLPAAPLPEGTL